MQMSFPKALFIRYGEWSKAVWSLQQKHLKSGEGLDWRYVGYFVEHDAGVTALDWKQSISGTIHSDPWSMLSSFWCTLFFQIATGFHAICADAKEYWDSSETAGPASRPQATFDGEAPKLQICALTSTELVFPRFSFMFFLLLWSLISKLAQR